MPPPNLIPFLDPLPARFPKSWDKARHPHDDGEFNARCAAVLRYEHGFVQAGRNGKRGNPDDLSLDVINWQADALAGETGPNPDPTGGSGWIIDFIAAHEAPHASITQAYTDPSGPGAWVRPLTLLEIDDIYGEEANTEPEEPPVPVVPPFPPRDEVLNAGLKFNDHYRARGANPNGTLGAPATVAGALRFLNFEGECVWLPEYLRRRQLGETHADAIAHVIADIDAAWS